MILFDLFVSSDCDENEVKRASVSLKEPTKVDYLSFDHVNHAVSNFVSNSGKNISNYPTPNAKRVFDKLRQAFT